MGKVLVFGHKNPDTDTICSAIVIGRVIGDVSTLLSALQPVTSVPVQRSRTQSISNRFFIRTSKWFLFLHIIKNEFCQ